MKLSLRDWEAVRDYAQICANELTFKFGLDVRTRVYTTYNGDKGIYLQLFDKYGDFYTEYASGIHDTVKGYCDAIRSNYFRIKLSCCK